MLCYSYYIMLYILYYGGYYFIESIYICYIRVQAYIWQLRFPPHINNSHNSHYNTPGHYCWLTHLALMLLRYFTPLVILAGH